MRRVRAASMTSSTHNHKVTAITATTRTSNQAIAVRFDAEVETAWMTGNIEDE